VVALAAAVAMAMEAGRGSVGLLLKGPVAGRPAAAMNATERQPNRHAGVDAAAGIEGEGGAPKALTRRDSRRRGRRTDAGVALEKTYCTDALTRADASRCCFLGLFGRWCCFFGLFRPLGAVGNSYLTRTPHTR
jgi:hypothetical protein